MSTLIGSDPPLKTTTSPVAQPPPTAVEPPVPSKTKGHNPPVSVADGDHYLDSNYGIDIGNWAKYGAPF